MTTQRTTDLSDLHPTTRRNSTPEPATVLVLEGDGEDPISPPAHEPQAHWGDSLLLNLDEAAEQLRCNRRSVERQIAAHNIAVVHIGRSVRIERAELIAFIAQLRTAGRPKESHGKTA